jgi:hypothetical protein
VSGVDTIQQLGAGLGRSLAPLVEGLSTPEEVIDTLAEIGVTVPNAPPSLVALGATGQGFVGALADLTETIEKFDEGSADELELAAKLALLLAHLAGFVTALVQVKPALAAELPANIVAATQLPDKVVNLLLDNFIVVELNRSLPRLASVLFALGLIDDFERAEDPARFQPEYRERRLRFDRLGTLLSDPLQLLRELYGWGTPDIDTDRLFQAIERLSLAALAPAERRYLPAAVRAFMAPGAPPASADVPEPMLVIPVVEAPPLALSVGVLPVPKANAAESQSLGMLLTGALGGVVDIPITERLKLSVDGEVDLASGIGVVLRPDGPPKLAANTNGPPVVLTGGKGGLRLTLGQAATPTTLLAFPGGSRLEAREVFIGGGVEVRDGQPDIRIDAGIVRGKLVITLSGADGFLAKVLPPEGIGFDFDIGVHWSQKNGLRLTGAGGIETTLVLNLDLGPIRLQSIFIALRVAGDGLTLELSATGGVALGPLAASVERVGLQGLLGFKPGNLGPADLALAFKPPNGLGLVVDAGPVRGGGYIALDYAIGRYSGVLQLEVFGVKVAAIGLLDTKMPDGTPGYSFLIIITTEFMPIQLGYGFTLLGVGGLAGINRTINAEALRLGVYAGSLDHILFPRDPVRNAPQLISDLSRIFPPAEGQHVFGPMAKLGWGTPTLIEISLGIIIELPNPVRIALLGQLGAFLPERRLAIVEIHVDFVAMIDFGAKLLSLDATLRDSRIVLFTLTGDMAMRLHWGDPPNFAIALGGFHPHFPVPAGFPALRRLSIAIGAGDWIRISCQAYTALTPNSLQFGARAELLVDVGVYVRGWIGFDALIIYSPFSFLVDFTAGLEVGVAGVRLASVSFDGQLSGPTPFRVRGEATISVLFFEVTARVDEKFGDDRAAELEVKDPWEPLRLAVADIRNWAAAMPAGGASAVTVAGPEGTDLLLLDPCGQATWRQKVVPLERSITRYGNVATPAPVRFAVDRVTVAGSATSHADVDDFFAPEQFAALSDAEKLSRPSFEKMPAGFSFGSTTARIGPAIAADIEYETRLIDSELESRRGLRYKVTQRFQDGVLWGSAAAKHGLVRTGMREFDGVAKLGQADDRFVAVSTSDLSLHPSLSAAKTKGAAAEALTAYLSSHPEEKGRWQVVPAHELEEA